MNGSRGKKKEAGGKFNQTFQICGIHVRPPTRRGMYFQNNCLYCTVFPTGRHRTIILQLARYCSFRLSTKILLYTVLISLCVAVLFTVSVCLLVNSCGTTQLLWCAHGWGELHEWDFSLTGRSSDLSQLC